ncbi:ADI1_2 [Sanghuangporus vaninii]
MTICAQVARRRSRDECLLQDSGISVPADILESPSVTQMSILVDEKSDEKIDQAMRGSDYKTQDVFIVTKEGLGNAHEKPKLFFAE